MTKRKQTDFPLEEFADRLNQLIVDQSLGSQRRFSVDAGLAQQTIHSIIKGKTAPSAKILYKICSHYGVSSDWLLFGEGNPYRNDRAGARDGSLARPDAQGLLELGKHPRLLITVAGDEMGPEIAAGSLVVLVDPKKISGEGIYGISVGRSKGIALRRIAQISGGGKYKVSADNESGAAQEMSADQLKPKILGKVFWHHKTPFPISLRA